MYKRSEISTGNSNWQADAYLIDLMRLYNPKSILDIGVGKWAKIGNLVRRSIDEWNWIAYQQSPIILSGIEGHGANIDYINNNYPNIYDMLTLHMIDTMESKLEILKLCADGQYPDVIVMGDIIEHFEKEAISVFINSLSIITKKAIIVQLPLGKYEQIVEINPLENHRSTWLYEDIQKLRPAGLRKFIDWVGRDFVVFSIPS